MVEELARTLLEGKELLVVRHRGARSSAHGLDAEPSPEHEVDMHSVHAARLFDELLHGLRGDERRNVRERRDVRVAVLDALEQEGILSAQARDADVAMRRTVTHAKDATRVVPHR